MSTREENEFEDPKVFMNVMLSELCDWMREEFKSLHRHLDVVENRMKRRDGASCNMRQNSNFWKQSQTTTYFTPRENQGRRVEDYEEVKVTSQSILSLSASQEDTKVVTVDLVDEPKIPTLTEVNEDQLLLQVESQMQNKEKVVEWNEENFIATNDVFVIPPSSSSLSQDFNDVIPNDIPSYLPSIQRIEHELDFVLEATLPNWPTSQFNEEETKELKRYIGKFDGRVQHEVFTNKLSFEGTRFLTSNGVKEFIARASDGMGVMRTRQNDWYAKQVNNKRRKLVFDPGGLSSLDEGDILDLRTNPLQEEGNDGVRESIDCAMVSKKFKNETIVLIQKMWAQELKKRPVGEEDFIGTCLEVKIEGKLG